MKKYFLLLLLVPAFFLLGTQFSGVSDRYQPQNVFKIKAADLPYEDTAETGIVREFEITAAPASVRVGENENFETWAYNGQVPGPELRVEKGDTIKISFTNDLPQATTLHFHGIRLSNDMDDVPGVTQDPIQPGETFIYEFTVPDAGTFWYHPHVRGNEQVERGLYGTIIVEDPDEPDYSQDRVLVLDDWRIHPNGTLDEDFQNMHDIGHDGRWGNLITVNGQEFPDIEVKQNERVRIRLVNTSNARVYALDFGVLDAKAIAVDGILVRETFSPNGFEIAPGNRVDIDITAPDAPGDFTIRDVYAGYSNDLFRIRITNESSIPRSFASPRAQQYPDMSISDYVVDREYVLDQGGAGMMHNLTASINGFVYPDYQESSLQANTFQVIRFSNDSARLHPMHLHGQFFKVIARSGVSVDEPFMRDTVLVHPHETVDVGIVPTEEGSWALHCHILEHAEAGMMTVVEVY